MAGLVIELMLLLLLMVGDMKNFLYTDANMYTHI